MEFVAQFESITERLGLRDESGRLPIRPFHVHHKPFNYNKQYILDEDSVRRWPPWRLISLLLTDDDDDKLFAAKAKEEKPSGKLFFKTRKLQKGAAAEEGKIILVREEASSCQFGRSGDGKREKIKESHINFYYLFTNSFICLTPSTAPWFRFQC